MKNLLHRQTAEIKKWIFFTETSEKPADYGIENDGEAQNVTREITDAEVTGMVESIAGSIASFSPEQKDALKAKIVALVTSVDKPLYEFLTQTLEPELERFLQGEWVKDADLVFNVEVNSNELIKVTNKRSDGHIDPAVEWTKDLKEKWEEDVIVDATLNSEAVVPSTMRTTLQNLDLKDGIKGNYISPENGLVIVNESGEEEKMSLEQGIVKAFTQLNVYVETHNVSDEIFTKACLQKGLDATDIKNLQRLRLLGKIDGTKEDVGILQNILKKVGLTKGLKKEDGTPDFLFGSGTVEDTESLCISLEAALGKEQEWDKFHDTLYPIGNGSPQRFKWGIDNIKNTGAYDPETNDPLRLFDETIVAEGGNDYVNGGKKSYTIQFLATLPEDVLERVSSSPLTKSIFLNNRELRKEKKRIWEEFQKQNPGYFHHESLAQE